MPSSRSPKSVSETGSADRAASGFGIGLKGEGHDYRDKRDGLGRYFRGCDGRPRKPL
jgi:hypothetical protein